MKRIGILAMLLLLAAVNNSQAWSKTVFVFCDANNNGLIDQSDLPLAGLVIVVTNASGSFIGTGVTTTEGSCTIDLPNMADSYVDFIESSSLPSGTTAVLPGFGQFSTDQTNHFITNSFLVESSTCAQAPPTNHCWLTGGGTIGTLGSKPLFSFGGVVYPGCKASAAGGGNWNVVDHVNKLHFKGTTITVVQCGNLPGFPAGSSSPKTPFNFIDFTGTGTLKGIAGNKANDGTVFFTARAADLGEPGKGVDELYLRVYDGSGQTLLLISATPDTPEAISPVPIRSGNLQLHISGCDRR